MNILRHDREVRKEKMLRQMVGYSHNNAKCFFFFLEFKYILLLRDSFFAFKRLLLTK